MNYESTPKACKKEAGRLSRILSTLAWPIIGGIAASMIASVSRPSFAGEAGEAQQQAALVKALPQSKLSLADGIRQAEKLGGPPISAKFEFDDAGKLSLSVYAAGKGLDSDAEHNVLKELSGSPEQAKWSPETEVFKDVEHVARSSEQLTLMRLSRFTLADVLAIAQKEHPGTVFSITPMVKAHRPVFVVWEATGAGKFMEFDIGLSDGKLQPAHK